MKFMLMANDSKNNKGDSCRPLLRAQQGVWVAQQIDPTNPRYNCGGYLEIHGFLDVSLFKQAVRMAVDGNEALRVGFIEDSEGLWQVIEELPEWSLDIIDISREQDPQQFAEVWMKADLAKPVNLAKAPLFHQVLFKVANERFFFYLRYHHIVMDGFGQTLYWQNVAEIYSNLVDSCNSNDTTSDYLKILLEEDSQYRGSSQFERDQNFWRQKFADQPEPARLANRSSMASRSLLRRKVNLSSSTIQKLQAITNLTRTRWSVIAIATTAAYIHHLTGVEEIVLGLPVSTRLTPVSRNTPCMLANELPLRLTVYPTMSLIELVRQVSEQVGLVLKHQRYRGEDLHRELRYSSGNQDLYGPVVNIISFDHNIHFASASTSAHHLSSGPVKDLLIGFYGKADGSDLQIYFDANPDLYSVDDIAKHQQRFLSFLEAFTTANSEQSISGINIFLPGERQQIFELFNATERPYDLSKCLHELIDEQAQSTPNATAVAIANTSITYRELADYSDRLAAYLRQQGVNPRQFVGVYEVRSLEMVIDLLAILKAGAAYVPLDPEMPRPRLEFQLRDADIRIVLSRTTLQEKLIGLNVEPVFVDNLLYSLPPLDQPLPLLATPESTAYVIYTSGSTGQPKGVAVPHRGVVNRLLWMQEEYDLGLDDCVLQKTPFTFDVSAWEFFWPLLVGSRLFLAEPGKHRDPRYVARIIQEHGVTTLHFVPPMLDLFLSDPESANVTSLRRVVCSGEALRPETIRAFFERFDPKKHGVNLYNLYGPTEASIDVTHWKCCPEDAVGLVPIGHPVANTRIYLLNQSGNLTPIGVPGELYIGGVQVASGYLNRHDLNQERFVPDPFYSGTMYRTGDLACYRQDGTIDFLGRLDHQVKVRGFRIELGEIESTFLSLPAITQVIATLWERTKADRRLVAYVVSKNLNTQDQEYLLEYVAKQLPEYMIPAHILFLETLPLLPNGKINRRALPEPIVESVRITALPTTSNELLLHKVWSEVLGLDQFGVEDSFFALGGDSMLSIQSRIAVEKHGYTFAIEDLFRFPTIHHLAKQLRPLETADKSARTKPFDLVRIEDRVRLPEGLEDAHPLSAMQAGMLFHAEYDEETSVYRVVTSLHIATKLDEVEMRKSIAATFSRHPALRSAFDLSTYSEPLQLVYSQVKVPLEVDEDLSEMDEEAQQQAVLAWIDRAKYHRFNPTVPPLLTFTVHRRGKDSFQLSVIEHHAVLDGWSDVAMLEEIVTRYRVQISGEELWLPEIASSYRDFVAEERRILSNEESRRFWKTMLQGVEPTPLPCKFSHYSDQRRTKHQAFDVPIPVEVAEHLRLVARQEGLPLKALLATAHVAVLRLVCNSDEVVTGIVTHGRLEEEGGDEVIGVFLNTLLLRVDTEGSLLATAHKIFMHERETFPHRRYPFAQIQRDLNGGLQLDSYVNFIDFHRQWHLNSSTGSSILDSIGVAETNFTLAVNFLVDPVQGRLHLWLDCDISVLEPEFCHRLAGYYQRTLEAIATTPHINTAAVELLDQKELDLIASCNDTAVSYDKTLTVHNLIEQQVRQNAAAIALVHRWTQVSYADLDRRANQLAHFLRENGVQRGNLVGVSLRRSPNLVITLLAILKVGAAYLPLDPSFPKSRLEFIASDAEIHCLVTEVAASVEITVERTIFLDSDAVQIAAQPTTPVEFSVDGDEPAYVIYTSGSTSKPKGTIVRHRNIINFFIGMDAEIGCNSDDVLLAVTSMSFDISVLELFWPLTHGAKVVIAGEQLINNIVPDEEILKNSSASPLSRELQENEAADTEHSFVNLCQRHGVTLLQSTPSFLSAVVAESRALESLRSIRALLVGGELFPLGLAERLLSALPEVQIFNMYGPTETTIWSTVHKLDPVGDIIAGIIPIGRPIANTEVMILDTMRRPLPIGVPGELWIGGDGVTGVYLNRPDLTAEKFATRPKGWGLMYRTGDRARWRVDGQLEFLGRVDRQVKILGHRIELDEVESVLSRHAKVTSVAVIAVSNDDGSTDLVAYISPSPDLFDKVAEDTHVQRWSEVWEGAYNDPESGVRAKNSDNDFAGWINSYTSEPIPPQEMQEWLQHTVDKIIALRPQSVVDIGVGVGLVMRGVAPYVERYLGLDVSATAIQSARKSLGNNGYLPENITLIQGDASKLEELEANTGDAVVLNSVIQYFPGTEYLERVLHEAVRVVGTHGVVFVGDVRNLDLLEAFHASVQLYRVQPLTPAEEIAATVARQVATERELCLSTKFFRQIADNLNTIGQVRVEIKRGRAINELTCFRYDVTLLGNDRLSQPVNSEVVSWTTLSNGSTKLAGLTNFVKQAPESSELIVTGIPNSRLVQPLALVRLFCESTSTTTAWDLKRQLWEFNDCNAVAPEDVVCLGDRLGRRVRLVVPEHGELSEFNAVFEPI